MNRKFRPIFLLLFFTGLSLQGFAFDWKGIPGINEGNGIGTTTGDGTEVKLPVGLPFQITDLSNSSGISKEDGNSNADSPAKIVYTFDLADGQGPESFHETHSAFQQARSINAACVLIRMKNMSSALDAAEYLSNEISDYDRPVMVYVNDQAISATQLISMASGNKKENNHSKQSKRTNSQVKSPYSTASKNTNEHLGNILDENNCTAFPNGQFAKSELSNGQNANLDDVLTQAGLNNYQVVHYSPGFFAQVIDWCMKPLASLLFIILIAFGLRLQMKTDLPGPATFLMLVSLPLFGIPLVVGGLAGAGEFGLALFLAIVLIWAGKKKSSSKSIQVIVSILFIAALSLCQSENFNPSGKWQGFLMTFLMTIATFLAGWFLPNFFGKSMRSIKVLISPAA